MSKTDRFKALGVLIVAGFIGGALSRTVADMIPRTSAQREKAEQVLKAGRFELVDKQGRTRAALHIEQSGPVPYEETSLSFYDGEGNPVVDLAARAKSPPVSFLELQQANGSASIFLLTGVSGPKLEVKKGDRMVWSAP